jgi:hypothetical protein
MACSSPCNCHNAFDYVPCNAHTPCGESSTCLGAHPCAYELQLKCSNGRFGGPSNLTRIPLWRECLFLDEWTDRTCLPVVDPDQPGFGLPLNCGERYGEENADDTANRDADCEDSYGGSAVTCFSCDGCTQSPFTKAYFGARWRLNVTGLSDTNGGSPDPPASFGGYLVYGECNPGSPTETPVAVYYSDGPWVCGGANTMIKAGHYAAVEPDIYKYLPNKVCVRPLANNPVHPCGLGNSDICDCEDLGCETLAVPIAMDCDPSGVNGNLVFTRITTGCLGYIAGNLTLTAEICAELDWPDAPCGVFVSSAGNTCDPENPRNFIFLLSCEGGNWELNTYCILHEDSGATLLSVTLIDTQSLTRTNVCEEEIIDLSPHYPQVWFEPVTIDATDSVCCVQCEPIEVACCVGNPIPTTIYGDVTASACAPVTITFLYDTTVGLTHTWTSTLTVGTCGAFTVTATMVDNGDGTCSWGVTGDNGAGCTFGAAPTLAANPCLVLPISRGGAITCDCGCITTGFGVNVSLSR